MNKQTVPNNRYASSYLETGARDLKEYLICPEVVNQDTNTNPIVYFKRGGKLISQPD